MIGPRLPNYEDVRLSRYKSYPAKAQYTKEELMMYYQMWVERTKTKADMEWHTYCDVRDCKPFGTNARIEEDLLKKGIRLHW